jgi:PAS domain S-box-containing protein
MARLGAVAAAYFLAGRIGLSLAYVNESASAVWPPAGIAVAALLILGLRVWPAVAAGAFLVNITTSGNLIASAAIAAGNTAEGVTAAWLVFRFAGGRRVFERTADILRFTALAALAPAAIAATVGTLALIGTGLAPAANAAFIWFTWWAGDAGGILVVTPLVVLWAAPGREPWTTVRLVEGAALAACMLTAAAVIFGESQVSARHLPVQFVTIPLLLWAAFRFGSRETATAAATLSVFVIYGTVGGYGPFVRDSPNESLLLALGFAAVITVVMLSVAAEVTARVRSEAEIRTLNQALEARVEARTAELARVHGHLLEAQQTAHIGSWEWDVRSNELWWSDELVRIYGMAGGAPPTYEAFLARVHPDDREIVEGSVRRALADGQPFSFDHRIVRPDGAIRVLHAVGRVVTDADGRVARMVGTGHDVTGQRAAAEQRAELMMEQAARREAERASLAKDQFLATLSHELRTPLNVALGSAHRLRQGGEGNAAGAVEKLYRNLQMLSRLVSDILDVSRITAGSYALDIAPVDFTALVEAAIDSMRDAAVRRGIAIQARLSPVPPLQADARRLEQVVSNLLANAVKFAPDSGRVTVSLDVDDGAAQLTVADNGPGIPEAFLPHVFEEFRQADPSITRTHGGLGLGLAIASRLVTLHGGTITAANRLEGGAIFTVRLPVETPSVSVGSA